MSPLNFFVNLFYTPDFFFGSVFFPLSTSKRRKKKLIPFSRFLMLAPATKLIFLSEFLFSLNWNLKKEFLVVPEINCKLASRKKINL